MFIEFLFYKIMFTLVANMQLHNSSIVENFNINIGFYVKGPDLVEILHNEQHNLLIRNAVVHNFLVYEDIIIFVVSLRTT